MAKKKISRLGKGLSSLMGNPISVEPPVSERDLVNGKDGAVNKTKRGGRGSTKKKGDSEKKPALSPKNTTVGVENPIAEHLLIREIDVHTICVNTNQPRKYFDPESLEALSLSIKEDGLMQPITLRPISHADHPKIAYEIVAGERRWRATMMAKFDVIPAIIKKIDNQASAQLALIENIQRQDLNPIEKAVAYQNLVDQFGLSHEQIAKKVSQSRASVSNILRLLQLCPSVRQFVVDDLISLGQAKVLLGIEDMQMQHAIAKQCIKETWSVRQLEAKIKQLGTLDDLQLSKAQQGKTVSGKSAHFADLEAQVGKQLGTKVKIKSARKKGAGTLAIDFYSIDQFDQLMALLNVHID